MTPRVASKTRSMRLQLQAEIDGSRPSAIAGPCRQPCGVSSPSKAAAVICSPIHMRKPMPASMGRKLCSSAAPCSMPNPKHGTIAKKR
eukprot:scaffold118078_cov63-Phaeocystis_antarctica.AAC.5